MPVDCALWDLDAKRSGVPANVTAGVDRLRPATTAYTISLDTPEAMEAAAAKAAARPILKIKLGSPEGDLARISAVRRGAPDATLIADANEGWTPDSVAAHVAACADAGFALVEQPLPVSADEALRGIARPVPLCADESAHDRTSLPRLVGLYDLINIKLDKTGGLTEALALAEEAQARGMGIFVGCMLASSLAMAPAMLLAPRARFVDLDGPAPAGARPRARAALRGLAGAPGPSGRCGGEPAHATALPVTVQVREAARIAREVVPKPPPASASPTIAPRRAPLIRFVATSTAADALDDAHPPDAEAAIAHDVAGDGDVAQVRAPSRRGCRGRGVPSTTLPITVRRRPRRRSRKVKPVSSGSGRDGAHDVAHDVARDRRTAARPSFRFEQLMPLARPPSTTFEGDDRPPSKPNSDEDRVLRRWRAHRFEYDLPRRRRRCFERSDPRISAVDHDVVGDDDAPGAEDV